MEEEHSDNDQTEMKQEGRKRSRELNDTPEQRKMRESDEAENNDEEPLATSERRSRTAKTKAKRQLKDSNKKTREDSDDMETSFTQDNDVIRVDAMSPFDQEEAKRPEEATPSPAKRPKSPKKGAKRKTTRRGR